MIPFNFHHLYYFYTIAKTGSVSNAATELRLAQPTLSAQLKQFENFLEKKLFNRDGRNLKLTDDGREVLSYAKAIFDLGKEFMDRQGDMKGRGKIRVQIGIDSHIPKTIVYGLIQFLFKKEPRPFVVLCEKEISGLLQDLQNHQLDFILTDRLPPGAHENTLNVSLLAKIPIFFCAHPKFKRLRKNFPASLENKPLLLPTGSSALSESVQNFFLNHRVAPEIIGEIQDVEVIRRLVLEGFAVAPLNVLTIQKAPASQRLILLNSKKGSLIEEKVYLISKKRKIPHPLIETILSEFRFTR